MAWQVLQAVCSGLLPCWPAKAMIEMQLSHRALPTLQGVTQLAERLPSCLLEKAFSKSLDVLSPLAAVERSPSQLLENALSLPRAGTLDLVLERFGSHRL